jgi:hypothetical protein
MSLHTLCTLYITGKTYSVQAGNIRFKLVQVAFFLLRATLGCLGLFPQLCSIDTCTTMA